MKVSYFEGAIVTLILTVVAALLAPWMVDIDILTRLTWLALCAVVLLIIVLQNIIRTRRDPDNRFPFVDLHKLKEWARIFANQYSHLERILLYESPYSDRKYVLFFQFDTNTKDCLLEQAKFSEKEWDIENYPINSGIGQVYKRQPAPHDFKHEWGCYTEKPNELKGKFSQVVFHRKRNL